MNIFFKVGITVAGVGWTAMAFGGLTGLFPHAIGVCVMLCGFFVAGAWMISTLWTDK